MSARVCVMAEINLRSFLRQALSLARNMLIRLCLLTSKPQGPACPHSSVLELRAQVITPHGFGTHASVSGWETLCWLSHLSSLLFVKIGLLLGQSALELQSTSLISPSGKIKHPLQNLASQWGGWLSSPEQLRETQVWTICVDTCQVLFCLFSVVAMRQVGPKTMKSSHGAQLF